MATQVLSLALLQQLRQALHASTLADESHHQGGPLALARRFLLQHLYQLVPLPSWAESLQQQLAATPSPHAQWRWEHERDLVLIGLNDLESLWQKE